MCRDDGLTLDNTLATLLCVLSLLNSRMLGVQPFEELFESGTEPSQMLFCV